MLKKLCLLFVGVGFFTSCHNGDIAAQVKPITVVIVGDSTVATYDEANIKRGWGQFMQSKFKENVTVYNLARSGRSSKSYIAEGLWSGSRAVSR